MNLFVASFRFSSVVTISPSYIVYPIIVASLPSGSSTLSRGGNSIANDLIGSGLEAIHASIASHDSCAFTLLLPSRLPHA